MGKASLITAARRFPALWMEPDAFLRYLPVIHWIKKQKTPPKILEIGSGDFGLTTYMKCPLVKADIEFNRSFSWSPRLVADGAELPFRASVFDLVFSADLMEHVPRTKRGRVLEESVRVAKRKVMMIFPCGEKAREQDRQLSEEYKGKKGADLSILKIHEQRPFPETGEIAGWLKPVLSRIARWQLQKSFNLAIRGELIRAWLGGKVSLITFLMEYPWVSYFFHSGECYRRILSIEVKESIPSDDT